MRQFDFTCTAFGGWKPFRGIANGRIYKASATESDLFVTRAWFLRDKTVDCTLFPPVIS
jgi:hypothetical protein